MVCIKRVLFFWSAKELFTSMSLCRASRHVSTVSYEGSTSAQGSGKKKEEVLHLSQAREMAGNGSYQWGRT